MGQTEARQCREAHGGVPGTVRPLCPRSDWRAWAGSRRALSLREWNRRGTLNPYSGARGAGAQTTLSLNGSTNSGLTWEGLDTAVLFESGQALKDLLAALGLK